MFAKKLCKNKRGWLYLIFQDRANGLLRSAQIRSSSITFYIERIAKKKSLLLKAFATRFMRTGTFIIIIKPLMIQTRLDNIQSKDA